MGYHCRMKKYFFLVAVLLFTYDDFNDIKLSMQQRKNIYLICKEALNNVAKYADAKNCIVEILRNENGVSIRISDDGKRINDQSETLGGNGLHNMKKRADELNGKIDISSEKNKGTILSLTFTF